MKVYSLYLDEVKEHRSYAAFHWWAENKLLFATKNGLKQLGWQTTTRGIIELQSLSFKQIGDGELLTVAIDKEKLEKSKNKRNV